MPYQHLTLLQRVELRALHRAKCTQQEIAAILGCTQGTVSRELARGRSPLSTYDSRIGTAARRAARLRANARFRTFAVDTALQNRVARALKRTLSPEQIAGRFLPEGGVRRVSASTIYRWIATERPDLRPHLRCKKGTFRRRRGTAGRIAAREAQSVKKWITDRPITVAERGDLGDWEGDTVKGLQGETAAIATAVDRRSGYLEAVKLASATAEETRTALTTRMRKHPRKKRRTITFDNGGEFAESELLEQATGLAVFFAHPYHSWERGTNENTNGLLREFFPKRTSLTGVTQREVDRAVRILNNRPRKRLGYRTPSEVFNGYALRMQI